jgi:hypothetical protein
MLPNMLRFLPTLAGVVLSLLLLTPRLSHGENPRAPWSTTKILCRAIPFPKPFNAKARMGSTTVLQLCPPQIGILRDRHVIRQQDNAIIVQGLIESLVQVVQSRTSGGVGPHYQAAVQRAARRLPPPPLARVHHPLTPVVRGRRRRVAGCTLPRSPHQTAAAARSGMSACVGLSRKRSLPVFTFSPRKTP